MNKPYKLILSNASGIQDAESTSVSFNSPSNLLLTSIQLHAAEKISRQIRFVEPHYEILVHLGREEEALLQARLTKSIAGLEKIFTTLKSKGNTRLDLLDEMLLLVKTKPATRHYPQLLIRHLVEAERYEQALEVISLIRLNYWNHVGILTQTADVLSKLGRAAEAQARFEETEQVIRQYHIEGDGIPPFYRLATALQQHDETAWADRLFGEMLEAIQAIENPDQYHNFWLWEHIRHFAEIGRQEETQILLKHAEQRATRLTGEKRINVICGIMRGYLRLEQYDQAAQFLPEIELSDLALQDDEGKRYLHAFQNVGQVLLDMGLLDHALILAQTVKENYGYDSEYVDVIRVLVDADDFDQAKTILTKVDDPRSRDDAQNIIALGLAKAGHHAEAEALYVQRTLTDYHRRRPSRDDHVQALVSFVLGLLATGQHDIARTVYPNVIEAIERISPGNSWRVWLFNRLATGLAEYDFPDLTMPIVQKQYFENTDFERYPRFDAEQVAFALAQTGNFDEALEIIRKIGFWIDDPNTYLLHSKAKLLFKTAALIEVSDHLRSNDVIGEARLLLESAYSNKSRQLNCQAEYLLRMKQPEEVLPLVEEVSTLHAEASPRTLISTACHWIILGQPDRATELMTKAHSKALEKDEPRDRADDLLYLLEVLLWAKQREQARIIVSDLQVAITAIKGQYRYHHQVNRRIELVLLLIKTDEVELSKPILATIRRGIRRGSRSYRRYSKGVRNVILALGAAGRWDEALSLSSIDQSIWNDWGVAEQLPEFLNALAHAGKHSEAQRIIQQAWSNVYDSPAYTSDQDDSGRSLQQETIGRGIAQSDFIAEAVQICNECEYPGSKRQIAFELANNLASKGRFPEALPLLDHVELDQYVEAFCKWVPALEKVESGLAFSVLREVIRIVGWVREDWHEIYELISADTG